MSYILASRSFLVFLAFFINQHAAEKAHKLLVVTIDSRKLDVEQAGYFTIGAVLNYLYAKKHGYEFKYFQHYIDAKALHKKYNVDGVNDDSQGYCFHPTHRQVRAPSWAKLPILWHISKTMQGYDYVVYVDPDTVFTPAMSNRSISQALRDWKSKTKITWGPHPGKASILFSHNAPYGDQEPAIGWFMFRPKAGVKMFSEWWDYNLPDKAKEAAYDQDALWKVLNKEKVKRYNFAINRTSAVLLKENQFPIKDVTIDDWCLKLGWICHLSSAYGTGDRDRIMRAMLEQVSVGISTASFKSIVETIKKRKFTKIESLATAQKMPKTEVIHYTGPEAEASESSEEFVVEEGGIRRDRSKATSKELEDYAKVLLDIATPVNKARKIISQAGEDSKIGEKATKMLEAYIEGQITRGMLIESVNQIEKQMKSS